MIRINNSIERMDSTMTRTKRYLVYFGKSFCKDKVVMFMLFLIFLTIVGIIIVAVMPAKNITVSSEAPMFDDQDSNLFMKL